MSRNVKFQRKNIFSTIVLKTIFTPFSQLFNQDMQKSEFLKSRDIAELLYHDDDDKCHKSQRREEEEMLVFHLKHSPSPFGEGCENFFRRGVRTCHGAVVVTDFIYLLRGRDFFLRLLGEGKVGFIYFILRR